MPSQSESSKSGLGRRKRSAPLWQTVEAFLAAENWNLHQAWLLSTILHTGLLVTLVVVWHPFAKGTGGAKELPPGIAVLQDGLTDSEFSLAGGDAGPDNDSSAVGGIGIDSDAASGDAPVSISDLIQDMTGPSGGTEMANVGTGIGGNGLSGSGQQGNGTGGGGKGGKTRTSFMGVEGNGASFVYVLDHSESMNQFDGAPLRFAKRELLNSIQSLQEKHQFQIVFYNDTARAFRPNQNASNMVVASDYNKELAGNFIRNVIAVGGTEHIPGLKMGLSFSPDVVFFLTDAAQPAMSETQLLEIQSRAERTLTTIHTIQFNAGPSDNDGGWLRQLAEMNRGKYRYVDINSIK